MILLMPLQAKQDVTVGFSNADNTKGPPQPQYLRQHMFYCNSTNSRFALQNYRLQHQVCAGR